MIKQITLSYGPLKAIKSFENGKTGKNSEKQILAIINKSKTKTIAPIQMCCENNANVEMLIHAETTRIPKTTRTDFNPINIEDANLPITTPAINNATTIAIIQSITSRLRN